MKLYIRQRVFTWGDKFNIMDEYGTDRYFVKGEVFTLGKKLHVYDMYDREVAFVEQKIMTWLPRYNVYIHGDHAAQVVREFSFFRPHYRIDGPGWEIEGDLWAHEYQISQGQRPVAHISKHWMSWGDSYELDIADSADELLAVATVLAIDAVLASQDN